jgi:two-component system sensor histidine kinase UhpB
VLDDLGLEPAIQRYADDFSSTHRIQVTFSVPQGRLAQLSKEEQLNLYRIIQEALTNVARHSRADRVNITFEYSGSNLVIHVRDNGRGIAPQQPDNHSQHLGIEGMRQRAAMLGGTLEVLSEATGVTVLLRVPARSAVIQAMDEVKARDVQDN